MEAGAFELIKRVAHIPIHRLKALAFHRVMWGADEDHRVLVEAGYATMSSRRILHHGFRYVYRITGKGEAALRSLEHFL